MVKKLCNAMKKKQIKNNEGQISERAFTAELEISDENAGRLASFLQTHGKNRKIKFHIYRTKVGEFKLYKAEIIETFVTIEQ